MMRGMLRASRWSFAFAVAIALLLSMSSPASAITPAPQSDEMAEQLVDTWIESLGGLEAYWPLQSARFTITTEIYDTETGRLRRTRPRYVSIARTEMGEVSRVERWEDDDFIQQTWNGEEVWAATNGAPLSPGEKDYDEVLYVSGDVHYWISLPFKLRDAGVNLHNRGRDDEGRTVVGVSFGEGIGLHDGDTWQYWFEDGKTWPVQIAYMEEGKTNWNYLRFEDIRTVSGYTFVGRRVHYNEAGQLTKVLHTHDFELNPRLNEALFSRPR